MSLFRSLLLWASKNNILRRKLPELYFVRKAVKRFMPGEKLEDAIEAAKKLQQNNLGTVFTYLGENLTDISEAESVKNHYVKVLQRISDEKLNTEISLKLTQLGLDLSFEKAVKHFEEIVLQANNLDNFVWIDMEGSSYTQTTLDFYSKVSKNFTNCGLCLQAYLYRTKNDVKKNLKINSSIRLVKGAYRESSEIAFQKKSEVDKNYIDIAKILLERSKDSNPRIVFGTHDSKIINYVKEYAKKINIEKEKAEFHLLYGIQTLEQEKLAGEGLHVKVLISYGEAWFPWYMRRLAERPANVWFVLKNIFSK
jgi:proline dehydrogenase